MLAELAAGAFFAGAFFAVLAFFAAVLLAFAGLAFVAGAFVALVAAAPTALAGAVAAAATERTDGGFGMVATVSLGSFLAPEMTFLSAWPALNLGTAFFFDLMRSPVCGLRTQRASRTDFSKEPKPVMATFSPRATSRVMVSSTDSNACAACFRFPSYRAARASMSCVLFTSFPSNEPRRRAGARHLLGTLGTCGMGHNHPAAFPLRFLGPDRRGASAQAFRVTGFQLGRVPSYAAMLASWPSVISMSSRPSSSRQRV